MDDQTQFVIDIDEFCRQSTLLTLFKGAIIPFADGPLRIGQLNRDVRRLQAIGEDEAPAQAALDIIGLKPIFNGPGLGKLDPSRPQIVIANQPFGAAEAPVIGTLLERHGCEPRILGTHFIDDVGPLSRFIISVHSFDRGSPKTENLVPLREAIRALRNNVSLILFPAGTVSKFRLSSMSVADPAWTPHAVQLARHTSARIVPVFVHGRNSWLFYALGMVHPVLRSLIMVRELYRQTALGQLEVTVGTPIEPEEFAGMEPDKATGWLRKKVYALGRDG